MAAPAKKPVARLRPLAKTKTEKPTPKGSPWLVRGAAGLKNLLLAELRHAKVITRDTAFTLLHQRNHDMVFFNGKQAGAPKAPLRLAEQVVDVLLFGRYKVSERQLDRVAEILTAKGGEETPWKVASVVDGAHFNRQDISRWLFKQLQSRGVYMHEGESSRPVWLFAIDDAFYLGIERSNFHHPAGRRARVREREGALPVTVAAAMAFAADVKPDDTVLDPVCGSGTLLAEVAALAPNATLLGFDIDPDAKPVAEKNLRQTNATIRTGNSTKTGLPPKSVNVFVANLPFGKQYGSTATNAALYAGLFEEMKRLGAPGWRAVVLTSDTQSLDTALQQHKLVPERSFTVTVRGEDARCVVLKGPKA